MCTVLQQHLAKNPEQAVAGSSAPTPGVTNGCLTPGGGARTPDGGIDTPASSYYHRERTLSPTGRSQTPGYSYLGIEDGLKRPIDPYDRKVSTPAMHFHVPPNNPDGTRPTSRQMNAYTQARSIFEQHCLITITSRLFLRHFGGPSLPKLASGKLSFFMLSFQENFI